MGKVISDFSDVQINAVQQLINARYQEDIELQLADSEVQIDPQRDEVTACPVLFWNAQECNFVILRTGDDQYRAQFFYTPRDQYSTQQEFFTTIEDCASAILREQSAYAQEVGAQEVGAQEVGAQEVGAREMASEVEGRSSGVTAADIH